MIEIRNLSKRFPTGDGEFTALEGINLTITDGDIFGIVGMSGAGKSTLVRCINLLERPTQGQILIDGLIETGDDAPVDLCELSAAKLRQARRSISMIFQQFNLLMQRALVRRGYLSAGSYHNPFHPAADSGHQQAAGHHCHCDYPRDGGD